MTDTLSLAVIILLLLAIAVRSFRRNVYFPRPPIDAPTVPTPKSRTPRACIPSQFVVFDLETTGLSPRLHEIIEIGAIRVTMKASTHKTLQMLVKPLRPIPRNITRLTGISQAMVDSEGVTLGEAITSFVGFIGDLPLVAYNAGFDMSFLEQSAMRCNVIIRNPSTCALKMARQAWPGRESYRLADLSADAGLSCEDLHRSLADCKRTMVAYVAAGNKLGYSTADP